LPHRVETNGRKKPVFTVKEDERRKKKIYQISFKEKIQQKITFFIESTNLFAFIKI